MQKYTAVYETPRNLSNFSAANRPTSYSQLIRDDHLQRQKNLLAGEEEQR